MGKETVSDIVGKDLAYEERTRQNIISVTAIGTIPAGVGAANFGPIGVPQKITKFKKIFGTPLTRDDESKEYTGLAFYKALDETGNAPYAWFTRVADSSAKKSSITINKDATYATINGQSKIIGKNYAIGANDVSFGFKYKNGTYVEQKISISPSQGISIDAGSNGSAVFNNIDVTTDSKDGFSALSVGDLIKIDIDGNLKQYLVQSGDLFARLLDINAGYLYTAANGGIGTATPGSIIIQFENPFATSLQATAPSSLFDNRDIVSMIGSKDIDSTAISTIVDGSIFKMQFSMSIDDGDVSSRHNYSNITITFDPFLAADPIFNDAETLATLITGKLVTAYKASGDILNESELPIEVTAVGNKIKFASKVAGNHMFTFANTSDVNTNFVTSLANFIGIGDIPATSEGSAYIVQGNQVYIYAADFTSIIKETPESAAVTKTIEIQLNPIDHNTMQKVLNKINLDLSNNSMECVASFIITGTQITGILIQTSTTGLGNSITIKNTTDAGKQDLFAVGSATNGIDVNNDETGAGGTLSGAVEGTAGSGNINKYVDRFAVAIKKHILNGLIDANGDTVNDAMTVEDCAFLDIVNTEGTKYGISLISQKIGADSYIKVYNFPILFPTASVSTISISGSNKTTAQIISEINTLLTPFGFNAAITSAGKLIIQAISAGVAFGINIISDTDISSNKSSVNLLKYLGIKDTSLGIDVTGIAYEGTDAKLDLGTFMAKYTGKEGDNIYIYTSTDEDGKQLDVYFNNELQDSFYNYSTDPSSENYIAALFADSTNVSEIVEFVAPVDGSINEIADGKYQLSGGISGTNVDEHDYIDALETYKDIEQYSIDVLLVSNLSSKDILAKLAEVHNARKDCFSIIDAPETVAGKINGIAMGGEDDMIAWHNGKKTIDDVGTKSTKLDSKFMVTYFPWILTTAPSVSNPKQWHAPSIEVLNSIVNCDLMAGDKTTPPAGEHTKMTNVYDVAHKIKNKGRLYDDKIGNNINPILFTNKFGFIIDGQKTTQRAKNKYSRIHVMRIGLYIKRKIFEIAPDFFWKPVTTNTRNDFATALNNNCMKILSDKGKIKSTYVIAVDEYNDTEVEADNGMIAAIEWTPVNAIEKIKVISTLVEDVITVTFE